VSIFVFARGWDSIKTLAVILALVALVYRRSACFAEGFQTAIKRRGSLKPAVAATVDFENALE
jgi:hypothetical protein